MTDLRESATRYLVMRRALGFKLSSQAQILMGFVAYCEQHQCEHISTDVAVTWAVATPGSHDRLWWARRLMVVRIFARHLAAFDPATEIPPVDVLPGFYRRTTPYLFSPGEIQSLLQAASGLTPTLRGATYRCLLGLLAVTGMRIGEACRLDRVDVDLPAAVITIRDSKFGKSRQIPVHASTVAALADYAAARDQARKGQDCPAFFVSTRGTRVRPNGVTHTFPELLQTAAIRTPPGSRRPHPHDLRHSFTVATLLDWYRDGGDAAARLPLLSTYLGHVDPKSTYWYLQATPELLALAASRLEPSTTVPR